MMNEPSRREYVLYSPWFSEILVVTLKVFVTPYGNSIFPSIFVLGTSAKLKQIDINTDNNDGIRDAKKAVNDEVA